MQTAACADNLCLCLAVQWLPLHLVASGILPMISRSPVVYVEHPGHGDVGKLPPQDSEVGCGVQVALGMCLLREPPVSMMRRCPSCGQLLASWILGLAVDLAVDLAVGLLASWSVLSWHLSLRFRFDLTFTSVLEMLTSGELTSSLVRRKSVLCPIAHRRYGPLFLVDISRRLPLIRDR